MIPVDPRHWLRGARRTMARLPSLRMGRVFISAIASRMATLASSSEKKVRLRMRPKM